jgi:hypothetical protein
VLASRVQVVRAGLGDRVDQHWAEPDGGRSEGVHGGDLMTKAMLIRVKRLERALGRGAASPVPVHPIHEPLMRRLALHRDLFREFAAMAEGVRLGVDAGRVGRLAAALAAREARA